MELGLGLLLGLGLGQHLAPLGDGSLRRDRGEAILTVAVARVRRGTGLVPRQRRRGEPAWLGVGVGVGVAVGVAVGVGSRLGVGLGLGRVHLDHDILWLEVRGRVRGRVRARVRRGGATMAFSGWLGSGVGSGVGLGLGSGLGSGLGVTMTFSGLRSRKMMPRLCTWSSAKTSSPA